MSTEPENKSTGNPELDKLVDAQTDRFIDELKKHLPGDLPPPLMLLKGHLLAEYYIGILLILHDNEPSILKKTFYEKVQICKEKDLLSSELIPSLEKLNATRNKMSHELEYTVSESDTDNIGLYEGKKYIIQKLENGRDVQKNLYWALQHLLASINVRIMIALHFIKKTT